MKKHQFFIYIFLLLLAGNVFAQKNDGIIFTVNATGSYDVLADIINISMNIGVENKDPQIAFDKHKDREKKIIKLIKKYGILDENISYSLFKISKYQDYRDKSVSFKTNQTIQFVLKDFKKYIPLQIDLLKKGFYEFSSNFSTSKKKEGHEKSVKNALDNAREEAELYAKNINLKIGRIVSLSSNNPVIYTRSDLMLKASMAPEPGLINISQHITITTNVNVVYSFIEQ